VGKQNKGCLLSVTSEFESISF